MFTGIVIEQGVVAQPPPRLRLRAPGIAADARSATRWPWTGAA